MFLCDSGLHHYIKSVANVGAITHLNGVAVDAHADFIKFANEVERAVSSPGYGGILHLGLSPSYQFERIGFFRLDSLNQLVFVRTVELSQSGARKDEAAASRSRKDVQAAQAAARSAKEKIPLEELFRQETMTIDGDIVPKYKEFDARGIPTVNADGTEVSKSAQKRFAKDLEKEARKRRGAQKEDTNAVNSVAKKSKKDIHIETESILIWTWLSFFDLKHTVRTSDALDDQSINEAFFISGTQTHKSS